jgi:hypothetical protein
MPEPGSSDRPEGEKEGRDKAAGLSMADVLDLPDPWRGLARWMVRQGEVGLEDVCAHLQLTQEACRALLATLVERGLAREMRVRGQLRYQVRLAVRRGRDVPLDIWGALDDETRKE